MKGFSEARSPPVGGDAVTNNQGPQNGEVVVYEASDGEARVDVRLEGETVWLTQRQMGEVFGTTPENVVMHLRGIFASGELTEQATTKDFLVVQTEGKRKRSRRFGRRRRPRTNGSTASATRGREARRGREPRPSRWRCAGRSSLKWRCLKARWRHAAARPFSHGRPRRRIRLACAPRRHGR